jgi:hypothetical protein
MQKMKFMNRSRVAFRYFYKKLLCSYDTRNFQELINHS